MSPGRETIFLFLAIGCVLVVATAIGMVLGRRRGGMPDPTVENLNQRIRAWWLMVALIGIAFLFGRIGVLVLFAFASFTALREFITLTETRRGDHYALVAAFFVILPLQYILIGIDWYGLYSIFIPVYAFLLLPIIAAIRADTTRFMERVAVTQWALMLAVFCVSHVPALITLKTRYEGRNLP
jgi:phosphatidate cytidylyltransferase